MVFGDGSLATGNNGVATVEIRRPAHNYFDATLWRSRAEAYAMADTPRADDR